MQKYIVLPQTVLVLYEMDDASLIAGIIIFLMKYPSLVINNRLPFSDCYIKDTQTMLVVMPKSVQVFLLKLGDVEGERRL